MVWKGRFPVRRTGIRLGLWLLCPCDTAEGIGCVSRPGTADSDVALEPGQSRVLVRKCGEVYPWVRLGLASWRRSVMAAAVEMIEWAQRFTADAFGVPDRGGSLDDSESRDGTCEVIFGRLPADGCGEVASDPGNAEVNSWEGGAACESVGSRRASPPGADR